MPKEIKRSGKFVATSVKEFLKELDIADARVIYGRNKIIQKIAIAIAYNHANSKSENPTQKQLERSMDKVLADMKKYGFIVTRRAGRNKLRIIS